MNRIGERMREYRRSIKMTQADFASRLGVTGAAVSAYETGNPWEIPGFFSRSTPI